MKKIYCDICGKEIHAHNRTWIYTMEACPGNDNSNYDDTIPDICENCTKTIYRVIAMLKEPDGKRNNADFINEVMDSV